MKRLYAVFFNLLNVKAHLYSHTAGCGGDLSMLKWGFGVNSYIVFITNYQPPMQQVLFLEWRPLVESDASLGYNYVVLEKHRHFALVEWPCIF